MNRRQWLASASMLAGLLPAAGLAAGGAAERGAQRLWLADPRYPQSLNLARRAAGTTRGWLELDADLPRAWALHIEPRLLAAPGAGLAGLTAWSEFLVLRDLARARGLLRAEWAWDDARRRRAPGERAVRLALWSLSPR